MYCCDLWQFQFPLKFNPLLDGGLVDRSLVSLTTTSFNFVIVSPNFSCDLNFSSNLQPNRYDLIILWTSFTKMNMELIMRYSFWTMLFSPAHDSDSAVKFQLVIEGVFETSIFFVLTNFPKRQVYLAICRLYWHFVCYTKGVWRGVAVVGTGAGMYIWVG